MKILIPVFVFLSFATSAQVIPTVGLMGDWPFDGNALDMSGNGNHGIVSAATPAHDRFGNPAKAYKFNGINSKITVLHSNTIDVPNNTSFSFTYWQKAYTGNVDRVILSKHTSGSWNGYNFIANNQANGGYCTSPDHIYFYTASGALQDACSNAPVLNDSTWRFVTGVYDAFLNQSFIYINAVLQTDIGQSSGSLSNNADMTFGCIPSISTTYFHGVLDGARLYNRVLTQNEITQLYNECVAPASPVNLTTANNKNICKNKSTILNASGSGTLTWYASPTSTLAMSTGGTYTTSILNPGTYTYYVASVNSCTSSPKTAVSITVSECLGVTSFNGSLQYVSVFPNPTDGNLNIKVENLSVKTTFDLYNHLGEKILTQSVEEVVASLDLKAMASGVYYLKFYNEEGQKLIKFIRQ